VGAVINFREVYLFELGLVYLFLGSLELACYGVVAYGRRPPWLVRVSESFVSKGAFGLCTL